MKVMWRTALLAGLLFLAGAMPVFASNSGYEANHVVLSWSLDNSRSQTITWHSPKRGNGLVQYGRCGESQQLQDARQVKATTREVGSSGYYRCEAVITGLAPQTTYCYRIGNGEEWGRIRTFTTAPLPVKKEKLSENPLRPSASFEFFYLGDVQYQNREKDYYEWGCMLQDARQRNPGAAFALLGGDMVNSSRSMKDWALFLENASPVFDEIPMMTAVGNHETKIKADYYLSMMSLPENGPKGMEEEFYSFNYGSCHILVLNSSFFQKERQASEADWKGRLKTVNDWIAKDLAESRALWKIAVTHHPLYEVSGGDPVCEELQRQWEPILKQGGVDLVLCGHQHVYMRAKEMGGITQIMGNSGKRRSAYFDGANTPEYSQVLDAVNSNYQVIRIEGRQLSVLSYDEEGQIIDKWVKRKTAFPVLKAAAAGAVIMSAAAAGTFLSLRKRKAGACRKKR